MTTFDPSNRKRDEAQQVDQAEVHGRDRAQQADDRASRADDADARRHDRTRQTDQADVRGHDRTRQADQADGRRDDRTRQADQADGRRDDRTRQADQADVRGDDRTRQTDKPGVRAEEARTPETRTPGGVENQAPVAARSKLFGETEAEQYRVQWRELQANFVDEPRAAVREAETLVSQMMDALTSQLKEQKRALEGGSDRDTEQLRVAMQRYRSLFDQMLQV
ncbi:hypothetical protein [Kibdelosporangium aridum]|uniref:Uncharacterized protein n=1 Tax=Kibdelosporangium aridum TaxID=2030 RepID=A0A1W2F9Q2_KIBAR|nr:hypothetical protein [Kibdelosporangium aridum]SMD18482.1 hypothetical protein SAMN05661093_05800 [Kibdelosporangium aridum]